MLDTRLKATYGARARCHRVTVRLAGASEASGFEFLEQSAADPEAVGRQEPSASSDSRGIRIRPVHRRGDGRKRRQEFASS